MKTRNMLFLALALAAAAFLSTAASIHAQAPSAPPVEAAAAPIPVAPAITQDGFTAQNLVTWLTPILVPLILAGVKRIAPKVPSWAIPIMAPVLGVLIGIVNSAITSQHGNFWVAALLGLAGVGLREVKEAVKPAPNGGWPQDGLSLPPS